MQFEEVGHDMSLRAEPRIWWKSSYSDANGECVELSVDQPHEESDEEL
ncbi:DUF397 domain-containing protein [Actinoallomurus sp. NPDC052308]